MMATYNGERFLVSQIESILNQENVDVTLVIHDDGSADSTCAICQEIANSDTRVRFARNASNLGVANNFMTMLFSPDADGYDLYAFSDQDDEWFPEKLYTAAQSIKWDDCQQPPTLYFSNIRNEWIDGDDLCMRSELEISRFRECEKAPMTLLVRNWVNGCAMVFNPQLRELLVQHQPAYFPRIHDVWVHMVARYCGTIIADYDTVLMRRRLTGNNVVGKTDLSISSLDEVFGIIKQLLAPSERPMTECAILFQEQYGELIHSRYRSKIAQFIAYKSSLGTRIALMHSKDYWLPSAKARIRMRLAMLLGFY